MASGDCGSVHSESRKTLVPVGIWFVNKLFGIPGTTCGMGSIIPRYAPAARPFLEKANNFLNTANIKYLIQLTQLTLISHVLYESTARLTPKAKDILVLK